MEQKQLRLFVAAAEEGNLTRAAKRANMTQQNASRLVRQLELEIGAVLFERSTKGLTLTEAGSTLLEDARQIIALSDRARVATRRAAGLDSHRLRLGFPKHGAWVLMPTLVKTFRRQRPKISLELHEVPADTRLQAVADQRLDIAFIFWPADKPLKIDNALTAEILSTEPVSIIATEDHRFARFKAVPLEQLAEERIIRWERTTNSAVFDRVVAACRNLGFEPRFSGYVPEAVSRDTIASMVTSGIGLALTFHSFMDCNGWQGLIMRPLRSQALSFHLWMVWRRDDRSLALQGFRRVVCEISPSYPRVG
jgi:LysR family transcriptional regulator, benzoate and cis,cis-muconate-responsive activator of ben and cat genes